MDNLEKDIVLDEQIENYLNKRLTNKDVKVFEARIVNDTTLAEEIAFRKMFRLVVKNKATIQFHQKVKQVMSNSSIEPDMTFQLKQNNWSWWITGSILSILLVSMISWNIYTNNNASLTGIQNLANTHIVHFENKLNVSPEMKNNLSNGLKAYDNQNYTEAIKFLEEYENRIPSDIQPQFYIGLSYLLTEQEEKAIPYFSKIIETKDELFLNHSQWYLGLSLVKTSDLSKAYSVFEQLKNHQEYGLEVQGILENLEEYSN